LKADRFRIDLPALYFQLFLNLIYENQLLKMKCKKSTRYLELEKNIVEIANVLIVRKKNTSI
jgi:hypothetical protein